MLWEILKASKGLPVDDLFAALWGKKIAAANDWQLTTLTGTLPLTFESKGGSLTDYKLYGTAEGAGVETESGEPTGYKLPLTITSGAQSQDIPIYIGDTKLGAEEYVDYGEQKIYRCYGELTLKGDEENLYYFGTFIETQTFYIDLPDNYKNVIITSTPHLNCNYYSTTYIVEPSVNKTCRYRRTAEAWNLDRIYLFDNDYTNLSDYRAHLAELYNNGVPLKISYLLKDAPVPTDPPVALPELSTYQGGNTLSCSEGLGEVSITGYIKEVGNG